MVYLSIRKINSSFFLTRKYFILNWLLILHYFISSFCLHSTVLRLLVTGDKNQVYSSLRERKRKLFGLSNSLVVQRRKLPQVQLDPGYQSTLKVFSLSKFCLWFCLPLEKAMTPHSSTLAWKIPWTKEPGRLQAWGH